MPTPPSKSSEPDNKEPKIYLTLSKIDSEHSIETVEDYVVKEKGYKKQKLKPTTLNGLSFSLFYLVKDALPPRWKELLVPIVEEKQDILNHLDNKNESFVLLIEHNKNIYAVTGGHGHFAIREHKSSSFGFDVLSRITQSETKNIIMAREKNLIGNTLGSSNFFRSPSSLLENETPTSFPQELKAHLGVDKLSKLGLEASKGAYCIAKDSFNINTRMSLPQLGTLIERIENIINDESITPAQICLLTKLSNKEIEEDELQEKLEDELYGYYQDLIKNSKNEDDLRFDLCHNNFETYLTASKYEVTSPNIKKVKLCTSEEPPSVSCILKAIKEKYPPKDKDAFRELMKKLEIKSLDEDDNEITKGSFYSHITCELPKSNHHYFYIEKAWYRIEKDAIDHLNEQCQSYIDENTSKIKLKSWNNAKDEEKYNRFHARQKNTIILDRITADNIELCDIMKWDEKNNYLYLIHVKKGFNNSMRDLCYQISIAAKHLITDSENKYLTKIHKKANAKLSKEKFTKLFNKDQKIKFVLAVYHPSGKQRNIKNIKDFESNIAKYCLLNLKNEMAKTNFDLEIRQID